MWPRFHVVDPWGNETASYNMAMTEIKDVAEDLVQDFIKERLIKAQGAPDLMNVSGTDWSVAEHAALDGNRCLRASICKP